MKLFLLLTCAITVSCVLASSPIVQVNIGPNAVANSLCDDSNNTCQGNQGNDNGNNSNNGNSGNNDPSNGNTGSTDNTGNDNNGNTDGTSPSNDGTDGTNGTNDDTSNNTNSSSPSNPSPTLPPSGSYSGSISEYCYAEVEGTCSANQNVISCQSSYGDFDPMAAQFSQMVRNIMRHSYEYLALYIQHSNYLVNRKGFAKLFRKLSDYKWNLAKYTISYITERGGVMIFSTPPPPECSCEDDSSSSSSGDSSASHSMLAGLIDGPIANGGGDTGSSPGTDPGEYIGNPDGYKIFEVPSLAFSADIEKKILIAADNLHLIAVGPNGHDVQSSFYLQETFIIPQRKILRNLVRYVSVLTQMMTNIDQMVALYQFDDFIGKFDVFA